MSRSPRTGIVERGGICVQPCRSQIGVFSTQTNWSVCASGWQLSHENVPVDDASASLNAMRPRLTAGCVGSSRATVPTTRGASASDTSTWETVLATALRTQAREGAPAAPDSSAIPRGTASTPTRPSTAPLAASTVKSLSEPAAGDHQRGVVAADLDRERGGQGHARRRVIRWQRLQLDERGTAARAADAVDPR